MIDQLAEINELFINGPRFYLQNVSVDNVIFGYHEKELKVLLQRPQTFTRWILPGGFIKKTETAESAATRVASQRTSLENLFLQQFKVFSKPGRNRDELYTADNLKQLTGWDIPPDHWMLQPFVSIGFYTLTEFSKVTTNGSFYMEECTWWDINALPALMFDHAEIIAEALKALRIHLVHFPIGYELLPKKFTLPEIRTLYETILEKELDDRNFSKKLLAAGIIEKLDEIKKIKGHRSPFLYKFNRRVYLDALKEGMMVP